MPRQGGLPLDERPPSRPGEEKLAYKMSAGAMVVYRHHRLERTDAARKNGSSFGPNGSVKEWRALFPVTPSAGAFG